MTKARTTRLLPKARATQQNSRAETMMKPRYLISATLRTRPASTQPSAGRRIASCTSGSGAEADVAQDRLDAIGLGFEVCGELVAGLIDRGPVALLEFFLPGRALG